MSFLWIIFPGYQQVKTGKGSHLLLWNGPWLVLLAGFLFKASQGSGTNPFLEIDPLRWYFLLEFYFFSSFVAYLDYHLISSDPISDSETDNQSPSSTGQDHDSWEAILSVYLCSNYDETKVLLGRQIRRNKKDPFSHIMQARLLVKQGERQKALKSLKLCRKFDKKNEFEWECEQLTQFMQLEN